MTITKIQVMKIHTSVTLIKIFCTSNTFILSLSKISIEISHVNSSKSHRFKSLVIVFILKMFRGNLVITIVQWLNTSCICNFVVIFLRSCENNIHTICFLSYLHRMILYVFNKWPCLERNILHPVVCNEKSPFLYK